LERQPDGLLNTRPVRRAPACFIVDSCALELPITVTRLPSPDLRIVFTMTLAWRALGDFTCTYTLEFAERARTKLSAWPSVGTRWPRKLVANQLPASHLRRRDQVKLRTEPLQLVVRSTRASCMTTGTPSRVNWTSNSIPFTLRRSAAPKAASVDSGVSELPPRWAMVSPRLSAWATVAFRPVTEPARTATVATRRQWALRTLVTIDSSSPAGPSFGPGVEVDLAPRADR
jgi:hypothetical protein